MSPDSEKHLKFGQAWSWFILAGVLVVILGVLAVSTQQRLIRNEEIMLENLSRQADFNLRSLEGATRASLRQGMLRGMMLQALVEEMSDHPKVISLMVLGPEGKVIAMGSRDRNTGPGRRSFGQPAAGHPTGHSPGAGRWKSSWKANWWWGRPFKPLPRPLHWAGRGQGSMQSGMGMGMGDRHGAAPAASAAASTRRTRDLPSGRTSQDLEESPQKTPRHEGLCPGPGFHRRLPEGQACRLARGVFFGRAHFPGGRSRGRGAVGHRPPQKQRNRAPAPGGGGKPAHGLGGPAGRLGGA